MLPDEHYDLLRGSQYSRWFPAPIVVKEIRWKRFYALNADLHLAYAILLDMPDNTDFDY